MKAKTFLLVTAFFMATTTMASTLTADDSPGKTAVTSTKTVEFTVGPDLVNVPIEEIERAYEGRTPPEAIRMYLAIAKGSMMGPNDGWFGPAQSRYGWNWLSERHNVQPNEEITREQFQGASKWFVRFDRNRDGKITAEDLDWSDRNPWVQQAYMVNRLFRKIDPTGDGKLTRDEWLAFFEAVAQGNNEVTSEDLRDVWLAGLSSGFLPGDAPTKEMLLNGLFSGEVGSLQEGPQVNDQAPDFDLKTLDGKQRIKLSGVIGNKPVVLCFGNFTCGPFRSMYPGVENVYQRFKEDAVFLCVYVREAHPTDGWKMEANTKVGVSVAQPKSFDERSAVAQQCHRLLNASIPMLVDEINDPTGNAYSGMPARLYVIDTAGRVAYKSGRGPFGFKTGEMEQALVMTLLDGQTTGDSVETKSSQVNPGAGNNTENSGQ